MTAPLPIPRYTPDAEHRFFVYCPENAEFFCFATAAERDAYADTVIDAFLDDFWDDAVERVVAGELTHVVQQTNRVERPSAEQIDAEGYDAEGRHWLEGWTHYCDYELQPLESVPLGGAAQRLVAAGTLQAAVALYKEVLGAHVDQFAAGTLGGAAYSALRAEWEAALLQTTRHLSRDPQAPAGQVAA